jgi:hypothetical protein
MSRPTEIVGFAAVRRKCVGFFHAFDNDEFRLCGERMYSAALCPRRWHGTWSC